MGDDNWDLSAVVRGCRISGSPAPAATRDPISSFPHTTLAKAEEPAAGGDQACFTELEEICLPFFSNPQLEPQPLLSPQRSNLCPNPSSSATALTTSTLTAVSAMVTAQRPRQPHHRPPSQISRSKRRKSQQKRVVCHAPANGASADMWAWRKYGQKPIKGSPFPRGYYKCSSSKGCPARKQVERSRTDPGTLVITYTAEHNHPVPTHRNSLAGSTRNKVPSSAAPAATAGGGDYPFSTAAGLSPNTPLDDELLGSPRRRCKNEEEEESEEDVLLVEDMEVMDEDDIFFMGFDDVDRPTSGGFDGEHFFASPWMASNHNSSNSAAAAAGGR